MDGFDIQGFKSKTQRLSSSVTQYIVALGKNKVYIFDVVIVRWPQPIGHRFAGR